MKKRNSLFSTPLTILLLFFVFLLSGCLRTNSTDTNRTLTPPQYRILSVRENLENAMKEAEIWNPDAYLTQVFMYAPVGEQSGDPILDFSFSSPSSAEYLAVSFEGSGDGLITRTNLYPDFENTRPELQVDDLTLDSVEFFDLVVSSMGEEYRSETDQDLLPIRIFIEPFHSNDGFAFVWRVTFGSLAYGSDTVWQAYFDIESNELINIEIHSASP